MPVVRIQALPQSPAIDITGVCVSVAAALAEVFDAPARQIWVVWHEIPAGRYVEGPAAGNSQPQDTHPPIVEVMAYQGRSPEVIRRALETAARVVCEALQIEAGNAFVIHTELKAGRVFTGGSVRGLEDAG